MRSYSSCMCYTSFSVSVCVSDEGVAVRHNICILRNDASCYLSIAINHKIRFLMTLVCIFHKVWTLSWIKPTIKVTLLSSFLAKIPELYSHLINPHLCN